MAVQGAGVALMVGAEGSPARRAGMTAVVAVLTAVAVWAGRLHRVALGATASVMGILGTVAGAGVASADATAGLSVEGALAILVFAVGIALLAFGAVALVRAMPGWWRLLAVPAGALVLAFVLYPVSLAINATNRPAGSFSSTTPADRGLAYRDVSLRTADGVLLSGWYLPSTNGAAVLVLPGSGSTRSAVLAQAVVLARHGYGALLLDPREHGRSAGQAMEFGWYGGIDIPAAVSFLERRPEVDTGRIAVLGESMGGEQALVAAASDRRIRAVVAEGATGMQMADHGWLSHYGILGQLTKAMEWVTYTVADGLSGARPPMPIRQALEVAACPVLLIAAGNVADEALAARFFQQASPDSVDVWVVPGAGHTGGLSAQAALWETRVAGFLEAALGPAGGVS